MNIPQNVTQFWRKIKQYWHDTKKRQFLVSLLIIALMVLLTLTVIANYFDYKIDFMNINPSEKHIDKYIDLYYPPTAMIPIEERTETGEIVNQPLFSVHILLRYDGDLVEGKKVDAIAVGYAYPKGQTLLSTPNLLSRQVKYENQSVDLKYVVLTGFDGTSNYNESSSMMPFSRGELLVFMEDYNNPTMHRIFRLKDYDMVPPTATITWDNEGDYSPYITFVDSNKTITTVPYSDYKIHVSGSEVVKQEKYARISTWLAIVLFVFTLFQSITFLREINPDLVSKLVGKKTEDEASQQQQITSYPLEPNPVKGSQKSQHKYNKKP